MVSDGKDLDWLGAVVAGVGTLGSWCIEGEWVGIDSRVRIGDRWGTVLIGGEVDDSRFIRRVERTCC